MREIDQLANCILEETHDGSALYQRLSDRGVISTLVATHGAGIEQVLMGIKDVRGTAATILSSVGTSPELSVEAHEAIAEAITCHTGCMSMHRDDVFAHDTNGMVQIINKVHTRIQNASVHG